MFPQSAQLGEGGAIIPNLQMRKLSLGEIKQSVQGPTTGEPVFQLGLCARWDHPTPELEGLRHHLTWLVLPCHFMEGKWRWRDSLKAALCALTGVDEPLASGAPQQLGKWKCLRDRFPSFGQSMHVL